MKLKVMTTIALLTFGGAVFAQAPAPGTLKNDRAAVKADAQAIKADREKVAAGENPFAPKAGAAPAAKPAAEGKKTGQGA